jgi:hypothetical protein
VPLGLGPFAMLHRHGPCWFPYCLGMAALLLCLCRTSDAHAHPELERGKRLMAELEFEAALQAFERAVDSRELSRDELLSLLQERALALHALKREPELLRDFVWLAALAPEHILDTRAPPDLVAVWTSVRDQARGALGLKLEAEGAGRALRLRAELTGTVPEGVQTRIGVRSPGGDWEITDGPETLLGQRSGEEVEAYAEALGLGGLVVAQAGAPERPLSFALQVASPTLTSQHDQGDAAHWLIGGSAVLAAAAVAVTSIMLLRDPEPDRTRVTPMVEF